MSTPDHSFKNHFVAENFRENNKFHQKKKQNQKKINKKS